MERSPRIRIARNRRRARDGARLVASLVVLGALVGCATTKTETRLSAAGTDLPKPGRILVYEFATSPEEIEAEDPNADRIDAYDVPQSDEDRALGHRLAQAVASQLVVELAKRNIESMHASDAGPLVPDDYLIKGAFVSVEEGSRAGRLLIGFGAGNSQLQSLVQIYLVTDEGLQRVSEGVVRSEGSKMPGILVPVGAGAAAGTALRSLAISGGVSAARELGSGPLAERAKATAEEIAERIEKAYVQRGWNR